MSLYILTQLCVPSYQGMSLQAERPPTKYTVFSGAALAFPSFVILEVSPTYIASTRKAPSISPLRPPFFLLSTGINTKCLNADYRAPSMQHSYVRHFLECLLVGKGYCSHSKSLYLCVIGIISCLLEMLRTS